MALTKVDKTLLETTSGVADATTYLRGDGTWSAIATPAATGYLGMVIYTATGTYTPGGTTNGTAGDEGSTTVSKIVVEIVSAGGGSGSCSSQGTSGGAGGGGAYALKNLTLGTDRAVITTCTPTVGAAGADASYVSAAPGATGGVSSFEKTTGSGSFTTVTAAGGSGGGNNNWASANATATPTTGDINIAGSAGHQVKVGGDSPYGTGGRKNSEGPDASANGVGYGAGGTCRDGVYKNGNKGTDGIIVIWEYA